VLEVRGPVVVEVEVVGGQGSLDASGGLLERHVVHHRVGVARQPLPQVRHLPQVGDEGVLDDAAEVLVVERHDQVRRTAGVAEGEVVADLIAVVVGHGPALEELRRADDIGPARPRHATGGHACRARARPDVIAGHGGQRAENGQALGVAHALRAAHEHGSDGALQRHAVLVRQRHLVEHAEEPARPLFGLERILDSQQLGAA